MRTFPIVILLAWAAAFSRDAAAQAIQQTIILNQKVMEGAAGHANQQPFQINKPITQQTTSRAAQGKTVVTYAVADAQRPLPDCGCVTPPVFSSNSGELAPGTQVVITSAAHDAVIFYTTDGWTPTEASTRYTGPIPINADTRLQAIAEEPQKLPSSIAEAVYTVNGPPAPKPEIAMAMDGILRKGTPLRLLNSADVSSETAQVGGRMVLVLDENVMAGETLVAAKGTQVEATITRVDRAGPAGKPGVLAFQVQSLNAHGILVPLSANLTLAAPDPAGRAQRISNASLVHVASAPAPGEEAEIEPGMAVTASVAADTSLHP